MQEGRKRGRKKKEGRGGRIKEQKEGQKVPTKVFQVTVVEMNRVMCFKQTYS